MAMFSQPGSKRQKLVKEQTSKTHDSTENFPSIGRIEYKGPSIQYDDTISYRYYNAHEVINGRTMEEWIKPSISISTFKSIFINNHGKANSLQRTCNDSIYNLDNKRYINMAHEFCTKLGIKYWTAFDTDFVLENDPFGDEQNTSHEEILELVQDIQQKTSMKFLWIAPNFISNPKFAFGACTSSDSYILMSASRQIKKCLEIAQKLNAEAVLIPSVREGYYTIINTDIQKELSSFARILKMASNYKDRLGFRGQLLLSPYSEFKHNDNNNLMMPYLCNPLSSICFLKHYNLERQYKLKTGVKHELYTSSIYNAVGSLEINNKEYFALKDAVILMKFIVENNGYLPGGINLKLTAKRDYMDSKDIFAKYVHQVDMLAKGLRIYAKMSQEQSFTKNIQQRYSTLYSGFGSRLSNGEATLEECEEQLRKHNQHSENAPGCYEHWETTFENFINSCKLN